MKGGNMNLFKRPVPQQRERQKKCKLKVKKGADGSYTKEITGDCSKEDRTALLSGMEE